MKKYLLSLLIIVGIFIIACGNEPYPDYYKGTPEDIEAIETLLDDNAELRVTEDMFYSTYIPLVMGNVGFFDADIYFRVDSTIIKQHVDSCATELSQRDSTFDLWFAKDTTCTVYLYDTFTVISLMHYDERHTGYYFWNGDTGIELDTVIIDTTGGYNSLDVIGSGERIIFFDRDDTGNWELKRISYGIYSFPAPGTEIPDIDLIVLVHSNGVEDTIIASSYDTTYTGHCMDRFRAIDSLIECEDGETLGVVITLDGIVEEGNCEFFASCGGARVNLGQTNNKLVISGEDITNLNFEVVVNDAYYYVLPEKDYKAIVWLIPVRIGGVQ